MDKDSPTDGTPVVIDTHWVLDLWAFDDPRAVALREAIVANGVRWLACAAMRVELARVLTYPRIMTFLTRRAATTGRLPECVVQQTLAAFDRYAQLQTHPSPAVVCCHDPDDQIFVDLAVAHRAILLSRDRDVLALTHSLRSRGICVRAEWSAPMPLAPALAAA